MSKQYQIHSVRRVKHLHQQPRVTWSILTTKINVKNTFTSHIDKKYFWHFCWLPYLYIWRRRTLVLIMIILLGNYKFQLVFAIVLFTIFLLIDRLTWRPDFVYCVSSLYWTNDALTLIKYHKGVYQYWSKSRFDIACCVP